MGLWDKLFGIAESCREAMRDSYAKHVRLAKDKQSQVGESPHVLGLYGALGTRYLARGINIGDELWYELAPFLAMEEQKAVEALAEYVIYQEMPKEARIQWLSEVINFALHSPTKGSYRELAAIGVIRQVAWCALLIPDTMRIIEALIDEIKQRYETE